LCETKKRDNLGGDNLNQHTSYRFICFGDCLGIADKTGAEPARPDSKVQPQPNNLFNEHYPNIAETQNKGTG
jgi:hypothetical protein